MVTIDNRSPSTQPQRHRRRFGEEFVRAGCYKLELELISPGAHDIAGCLTLTEKRVYFAFRFDKRKREWLAGRLAAKRLARKKIAESGLIYSDNEIAIEKNEAGAPYIRARPCPWPISISHSGEWAVAAMMDGPRPSAIGVDIEKIEDRDPSWLDIAFDAEEKAPGLDSAEQTLYWTRKEAVSKLLGIGLSTDLRDIRFPSPTRQLVLRGKALTAWDALGRPKIYLDSPSICPGYALTVAYSAPISQEVRHGN